MKALDFFKSSLAALLAGTAIGSGGAGDRLAGFGLNRFRQPEPPRYRGNGKSYRTSMGREWNRTHGFSGAKLARRAAAGTVGRAALR